MYIWCTYGVCKKVSQLPWHTNGGENLCHKSVQQSRPMTPKQCNKWRINETSNVPTVRAICGVKMEHSRLNWIKTY
jgi:hypothetical protein